MVRNVKLRVGGRLGSKVEVDSKKLFTKGAISAKFP